jgi:CheY-like chemotaxis protein
LTFYWSVNPDNLRTPIRLLLVEDDPDNLEALSLILSERYDVLAFTSPTQALKAVEAVKPDVLVLDIGMGPPDGVQSLKAVRAMPGYLDVPAVALTGYAGENERQTFLAAGFRAVVVKPLFDPGELVTAIESVLESPRPGVVEPDVPAPPAALSRLDGPAAIRASLERACGKTNGPGPA